jgi:arylsulfatase A-like enzyme
MGREPSRPHEGDRPVVSSAPVRLGAAVLALIAMAVVPRSASPAAQRPAAGTPSNVVVILTDDQRWDTLWAMPFVQSELVAHGVNFTNGFVVNSDCCPSRTSILTGKYSHGTGIYKNNPPNGGYQSFKDTSTAATWLHAAGYHTGMIGKYLNGYSSIDAAKIPPGWDKWVAFTSDHGEGDYFDYSMSIDGVDTEFGSDESDYSTNVLADQADTFIRTTPAAQPLFLYFAPKAPHLPATPDPPDANAFSDLDPYRPPNFNEADVSDKPAYIKAEASLNAVDIAGIDEFRKDQYRTLLAVDRAVDEIVQALTDTGRLSNTLIVFTSDNGIAWGEHRWDKKKLVPYEESIRVPMVVRYDPVVTTPRTDASLVANIDLAPTIADVAGVTATGADGMDLVPLLANPGASWRTDFLVEHEQGGDTVPTFCALRNEDDVYVSYVTGEEELYDLNADPYELTNVASDPNYQTTKQAMRTRLTVVCNPAPPSLYLSAPMATTPGTTVPLTGSLGYPLSGGIANQTIRLTRRAPDGTVVSLPSVRTDAGGDFTSSDVPPGTGAFVYTARWNGNHMHNAASYSATVNVNDLSRPDYDGDGVPDLIVGVPGESIGTKAGAGALNALFGAVPAGLGSDGNQFWKRDDVNVLGESDPGDAFGSALAAGDFDGDGHTDIAVGVPTSAVGSVDSAGSVNVLYGSDGGLAAASNQLLQQGVDDLPGSAATGNGFGVALAAGDFNGDGVSDLAVGSPGQSVSGKAGAGAVTVLYGQTLQAGDSQAGLQSDTAQVWTQDSTDVLGTSGASDAFASALAAGDFNGDGYADLAIGVPNETASSVKTAGGVNVLFGGPDGLTSTGNQLWKQGNDGILDTPETGDHFGASLAAGDLNGDGSADLAVGVPQEDVGTVVDAGAVNVLYGSTAGLTSTGNQFWTQNSSAVLDTAETNDTFGASLAAGDVNGDGSADLAVGVPNEGLSGLTQVGAVNVLYGSAAGVTSTGNQLWDQDSTDVPDSCEASDHFGTSVTMADFNGDGEMDLAVGVPDENLGTTSNAGGVDVLNGGTAGLTGSGSVQWTQDSTDIKDTAEAGDRFGAALAVAQAVS